MFARDLPSKMNISIFFWVLIVFFNFIIQNIFIIIIDIILRCCGGVHKDKHLKIIFILYLIDDHYHYHYLRCCWDVRERPAVQDEHLKFIFSSSFFFIIIITIINIILILGIVEVLTKNLSSKMTISVHNYLQNFSHCFMLLWYNTINFVNHWLSLFLFSHLAQI